MKFLGFFLMLAAGSTAFADNMPKGQLTIQVIRREVVLENGFYNWKTTTLCKDTFPFDVIDNRNGNGISMKIYDKCKFTEQNEPYQVRIYQAAVADRTPIVEGGPQTDKLSFGASMYIYSVKTDAISKFPRPQDQFFATRDLAIGSAILTVSPEQYVSCGSSSVKDCKVKNPVAILAVLDYEVQK